MIGSHELKRRDIYLNKLIGFRDTEPVKVVTGIRRCGKSSLLKLMIQRDFNMVTEADVRGVMKAAGTNLQR